jgi:hypothetical protein
MEGSEMGWTMSRVPRTELEPVALQADLLQRNNRIPATALR